MEKLIAILFLSIYLLATTEVKQLFKTAALVEHYSEHKQHDSQITIWKFLAMHYANGVVNDGDYDKDMQLPFKSHADCISSYVLVCIPHHPAVTFKKAPLSVNQVFVVCNDQLPFSNDFSFIWQPPKSC